MRAGERIEHFETVSRRKDGTVIDVSVTVSPVANSSGTVIGASAITRDVTDRKHAEAALREAEELFHRVFDEAPIGMALLDLEHRFVGVNGALCEISGYSREQLEATNIEAITHPDDLDSSLQEIASPARRRGRLPVREALGAAAETAGAQVWVAVHTSVLRDGDAQPRRLVVQIQDITDRRRSEEQLGIWLTMTR